MRVISKPQVPTTPSAPWVPAWWYPEGTVVLKKGYYFEVVERYDGWDKVCRWMQIPTPEDRKWLK